AEAQQNLGNLYAEGRGVPQDYAAASKWFQRAAAQGHAWAQAILGGMYASGEGIPQDYVQAYKWFSLAAAPLTEKQVRDEAAKRRDSVAARMTPAQLAEAQKLARDWKKQ